MATRPSPIGAPLRVLVASLLLASGPSTTARAAAAPAVPSFYTAWGSTGSAPGQFSYPFILTVDAQGHVYVADSANDRVQEFDRFGDLIRIIGSTGSLNGQFSAAEGVATDAAGDLYVSDWYNNRVQKFDANGNYLLQWGSLGTGPGQFNGPEALAVDAAGNVYVAILGGIGVLSPDGAKLGTIAMTQTPTNCAFGGPQMSTMFITARTALVGTPAAGNASLYRIDDMPVPGITGR